MHIVGTQNRQREQWKWHIGINHFFSHLLELLPVGDEISRPVWVMKEREFVRENQKFCERKQFAQGQSASQRQSRELNILKRNECFCSESLIKAPASRCQEFSPGGRWELQWPSWNYTFCLKEKGLFRLLNWGTWVPRADLNLLSLLSVKMLSTSLLNLSRTEISIWRRWEFSLLRSSSEERKTYLSSWM